MGLEIGKIKKWNGIHLLPAQDLRNPWILLQDSNTQICGDIHQYIKLIPHAELLQTDKKDSTGQLKTAIDRIAASAPSAVKNNAVSDLPLVELAGNGSGDTLVIMVSGDGGWVSLDHEMGNYWAANGISVVGFDSLRYFWNGRTSAEASKDLNRVLSYYLAAWKKKKAVVAGYSMGADVLPFMLKRLPDSTLKQIAGVALIGPSAKAEFQTGPPITGAEPGREKQIRPTLKKIATLHLLCIGGAIEKPPSLCSKLRNDKELSKQIDIELLGAGHMFGMNPKPLCDLISEKFNLR